MREADKADDECVDLRNSWRTFMVPAESTKRTESTGTMLTPVCGLNRQEYTLLRRYRLVGTSRNEQSLLFLSLVSPNRELLSATTHLFIQLNAQYRQCVTEDEENMTVLCSRHEEQLADLLEAANRSASDMVVTSDVTQRFVLKHQCELEELQQLNLEREKATEVELRQSLLAFLKTSAPEAMAVVGKGDRGRNVRAHGELLKRTSSIAHFAPSPVPVRMVELPNLLRHEIECLRLKDTLLRPVVVDISPLSFLPMCLHCIYAEEHDTAPAVEEHLLRLSQQTHSVLLLIGAQREVASILSSTSAELFLQDAAPTGESPCFVPLLHHRHLLLMLTTRFWGANIVLLWTPPKVDDAHVAMPLVVEDALNLAYSWNADMFSVAVMRSAVSMHGTSRRSAVEHLQDLSMEVLRQLQSVVARLAYEAAVVKPCSRWELTEEPEEQQQHQKRQQRLEDEHAVVLPTSAAAPQVSFNTTISIRLFLPDVLLQVEVGDRCAFLWESDAGSVSGSTGGGGVGDGVEVEEGMLCAASSSALQGNSSFSSDCVTTQDTSIRWRQQQQQQQQQQPMTFKKLLVYTFGGSVVVH